MPPTREVQIIAGLRAATLLVRGKELGVSLACLSPEGAARSFWAAVFCLPAFLVIRLLAMASIAPEAVGAELVGYVLGWALFPLAALPLAEAAGRGALWPVFVAAWNWANLGQYAVLGVALLVGALLPDRAGLLLGLAGFAYVLWLQWFVARAALRVDGLRAASFVLLDVVLGLVIAALVGRIAGG